MWRSATFVAALAGVLAASAPARADDCMCFAAAWETPWDWPSDGGDILSIDPSELVSRRVERAHTPKPSDILWCVSPDDPRCAPAEQAPERHRSATSSTVGGGSPDGARPPPPDAIANTDRSAADTPSDWMRRRIDRPPQA